MWLLHEISILLFAYVILTKAEGFNDVDLEDILDNNIETSSEERNMIEPRDFLLSWQAQRSLRKILDQMSCGWPEYDIPPLAPYTNENFTLNLENNFTTSFSDFQPLHIDGLNNMDIDALSVSFTFKKVQFDFNFPNITATGKFNTSTVLSMAHAFGLKINFKANGDLNFGLENLRLSGSFKYKLPFFLGSAKIYKLKMGLTLGNVRSELKGTINHMPISKYLNNLIESNVLNLVNSNELFISSMLEQILVPRVNDQLKGKTLWNIILWSMLNRTRSTCLPRNGEMESDELKQMNF